MNRIGKAAVWIVLSSVLAVAGWKSREEYQEYRLIVHVTDELAASCKVSGPPCIRTTGWSY